MQQPESFECNTPDIVFENFGDESIILNLKSGNYYSLNPQGMVVWELLSQSVPVGEISSWVVANYGCEPDLAKQHIDALLRQLTADELLRPSATKAGISEVERLAVPPDAWGTPEVSKYDDIASMLVLDPVHDVTEAGWPHPAPRSH